MKYNVGDLLLVKICEYKNRPYLRPQLYLCQHPRLRVFPELFNSCGIITEAIKHSDAWEGSSEKDNSYVWYSQIDGKEYYFFEDELTGEVVE